MLCWLLLGWCSTVSGSCSSSSLPRHNGEAELAGLWMGR